MLKEAERSGQSTYDVKRGERMGQAIDGGPLYFAGAKLVKMLATAPPFDQWAVFHTVVSFGGEMSIAFTACRETVPDAAFYAECIEASFHELKAAALGEPKARPLAAAR